MEGKRYKITRKAEQSALIRRCDGCQVVTAIDLDNTLKHKREMQMIGQTVYEVSEDDARTHFKSAGPCQCKQNATTEQETGAMTFKEKCKLVRIHGAIDDAMGDTDPDCCDMTDDEIRRDEPLLWAAMRLAKMIGPGPWDKYLDATTAEQEQDQ